MAVSTLLRRPIMPREGIWNSISTRSFWVLMEIRSPLRRVTISITLGRTVFFRHIDGEGLPPARICARRFLFDHLRLTYLKLISFTAHCLDQDREVKHATAKHYPHISSLAPFSTRRARFRVELTLEAVPMMARGHIFSIFSEERRIVDGECHRHGRLVDSDAGRGSGLA